MKRRHVHLLFGLSALGFALIAGHHGVRLQRAVQVNAAIATPGHEGIEASMAEAALARALALAEAGQHEAAVKAYKDIIRGERADLGRIARYNLGNLYMRQASSAGPDAALALPLVELAKQSYRDLLREHPGDWDARYNLERALWRAPEVSEEGTEASRATNWQRRTVRALPSFRLELP